MGGFFLLVAGVGMGAGQAAVVATGSLCVTVDVVPALGARICARPALSADTQVTPALSLKVDVKGPCCG